MTTSPAPAPVILVAGYWLGAWAWDEVVPALAALDVPARALTLPGLESAEADRSGVGLEDHVEALAAAVRQAGAEAGVPPVVAVHSGAGAAGYVLSDRMPDRISAMVYVDSGPATGSMDPDLEGDLDFPGVAVLAERENLDGVSEAQLSAFERRAVPEPGGVVRATPVLRDDRRLDVPTTMICTAFDAAAYREAAEQGMAFLGGLQDLRAVSFVDLPTSHWPMWSAPGELAEVLAAVARRATAQTQ